ncbi:MAG: DNA repair protein RecN [Gammaproteobacteria bacterium]|nr:DNA repair protein RecN [Gammaproteobacteria bacterium]
MLNHIHVRNLAIVDEIEVELGGGMTALTGETGAGKSILVDALGLVLGDRAEGKVIRHGAGRAEISASFDISGREGVGKWLAQRDMDLDGECQLRRIINRDGRSRGYINGQPAQMQALRELGEQLVDIHGQHEHQSLLRSAIQRQLLDNFGGYPALLAEVTTLHREWQQAHAALECTISSETDRDARIDLLRYQLNELEALGLSVQDIASIDEEHTRQANAGRLLEAAQRGLERLDSEEGDSAASLVNRTLDEIGELTRHDSELDDTARLLGEAAVLVQESVDALRHYAERLEIDPERLQWLEQHIGTLHDLARKHQCKALELPDIETQLRGELESIENADANREKLAQQLAQLEQDYRTAAKKLTTKRRQTAKTFGKEITAAMQTLGMASGVFEVSISPRREDRPGPYGMDNIEFMVSANKGQPVQPLGKVASGGELSRISLSIQVISADSAVIPTLIFDEVDSGIGGGVAEIVGTKLRALAGDRQVLCVTHLPQVAAMAHQQLQVNKLSGDETTHTRIRVLDEKERIEELARMLGGVKITRQTREHAREMLGLAGATSGKPARRKKSQA